MARAFAEITFTPAVKSAQQRYGSREANQGFERTQDRRDQLGRHEAEFVSSLNGFYQATVGENGWPYVQFRGGPPGFLKVLDEKTIGYADFRGNRQYLSVGNLGANPRVALIFMDYQNRRRIKIWGTARIVELGDDPALIASLTVADYKATVERGVIITVEAYEWNCPQHIGVQA
jgi:predicted pyridoxine 5'-phosphate oxidase superfamily flavin-nucleotide-binding protein